MFGTMLDSISSKPGVPPDPGKPAELITKALPYVFGAAGIVLVLNIISSGLKMMTSKGDPKVLQGAQAKLTTSAIGILILFTSFWIVKLIFQFLGLDIQLFK
ncbi:MAG: hypothetical protein ACD_19C00014G0011 [uncultured bacterium]|nr:MAG: hypothetical protein ACD_19C00014G0011 [uncultured bacterium]